MTSLNDRTNLRVRCWALAVCFVLCSVRWMSFDVLNNARHLKHTNINVVIEVIVTVRFGKRFLMILRINISNEVVRPIETHVLPADDVEESSKTCLARVIKIASGAQILAKNQILMSKQNEDRQ